MSIINNISSNDQTNWQAEMQQRKNNLNDLEKSLNSGDLEGAKKAFTALQQMPNNHRKNNLNDLEKSLDSGDLAGAQKAFAAIKQKPKNQVKNDLNDLEKSLNSGDLAGAKNTFTTLKQDLDLQNYDRFGRTQTSTSSSANLASALLGEQTSNSANLVSALFEDNTGTTGTNSINQAESELMGINDGTNNSMANVNQADLLKLLGSLKNGTNPLNSSLSSILNGSNLIDTIV